MNAFCFRYSDYPFILSIETYCSLQVAEAAVKSFQDILGSALWTPSTKDFSSAKKMYSPYQLRKKILVMSHAWFPFKITGSTGLDDEIDDTLKIKMILSPITALFVEDKRIKDEEMATNPFACSNMWARDFRTYLAAEGKKEVRMETRKNLWKVTHKDISAGVTLDPWEFWNNGVCMVGQNHSKCDKYILYGHGKFSLNGGVACGYVAKPPVLIDPQAGEPTLTTQFTFTLISGQNLSQLITKRNPELEYHMYVEVEFVNLSLSKSNREV